MPWGAKASGRNELKARVGGDMAIGQVVGISPLSGSIDGGWTYISRVVHHERDDLNIEPLATPVVDQSGQFPGFTSAVAAPILRDDKEYGVNSLATVAVVELFDTDGSWAVTSRREAIPTNG